MIRTLHLTNAYHAHSGGIRTFYRALIDEANRTGRSMRLIVPSERHAVEEVGEHARVFHVRAPRSPWIDPRYRVLFPSQFLLPWRRLVRILRQEQPDLVEVCDKYSLCYLAGVIRRGWIRGLRRPVLVGLGPEAGGLLTYACRETAWLAEPAPDAFAEAVRGVFADVDRRQAIVARAVSRAREYAWPRSAGRFLALYDELVRSVRAHAAALNPARVLRSSPPFAGAAEEA